jgi:DNA mismatch endonuclease, patch repair protein
MIDHVSRERRSTIMGAIRGKNTTPERLVRSAAHRLGLRFRLHGRRLPGRPDLVLPKWRTVVFVHGCFWHRHLGCKRATMPRSNVVFWKRKFRANTQRDAANYARLADLGWRVVIIWQCELGRPGTLERATSLLQARFSRGFHSSGKIVGTAGFLCRRGDPLAVAKKAKELGLTWQRGGARRKPKRGHS